jgi:hypothetical protein
VADGNRTRDKSGRRRRGIGGLAAGIALERAGLEVDVYERADAMHEVGAGISLWANAIHAWNGPWRYGCARP